LFVCLFVSNFAGKFPNGFAWNFQGRLAMRRWTNDEIFGGNPNHRLDTWIVFRIRHYWEIQKVVSIDCAARRCSARHALTCIAIATMTSLRHRPTTDNQGADVVTSVRRALAGVCTVPVLLVISLLGAGVQLSRMQRIWLLDVWREVTRSMSQCRLRPRQDFCVWDGYRICSWGMLMSWQCFPGKFKQFNSKVDRNVNVIFTREGGWRGCVVCVSRWDF